MLIAGIALGLALGLLLGGRLENLANIRLRFLPLLFVAVIFRFAVEAALGFGLPLAEALRMPLLALAYGLLLFVLWKNRWYPGLALAMVGITANGLAILANGGRMPVWAPAYEMSGIQGPINSVLHFELTAEMGPEFLLGLGPLADIIPIPFWPVQNVASLGDLFLTAGLAFFLFATILRAPQDVQRVVEDARTGRYQGLAGTLRLPGTPPPVDDDGIAIRPGTGLTPSLDEAIALERPTDDGCEQHGSRLARARPAATRRNRVAHGRARAPGAARRGDDPRTDDGTQRRHRDPGSRRPSWLERARQHPYVRLAVYPSFSALWTGQIISLFGDRVNQIALAAFVYEVTDSPWRLPLRSSSAWCQTSSSPRSRAPM